MKDYYYILGVSKEASESAIKQAYRKLSTKFHPDKNNGDTFFEQRFRDIAEAYEILIDPASRERYDLAIVDSEYAFEPASSEFSGTPFARGTKRDKAKITMMLSVGSILLVILGMMAMGVFMSPDSSTPLQASMAPAAGPLLTAAKSGQDATKEEVKLPDMFNDREQTEAWILTKLDLFTPRTIKEMPAGVLWWDTLSGHQERNYSYQFSNGYLIVGYESFYTNDRSAKNKVLIPVNDIDRVYSRQGKLWITTKGSSIIDDNLTMKYSLNSSVFSVRFNGQEELLLDNKITDAFAALKQHYSTARQAQAAVSGR